MAEDDDETTVDGFTAYEGCSTIKGFATDELLLMGGDEESFSAILASQRAETGAGVGERLAKLLQPSAGAMVMGAVAMPESFGKLVPEENVEEVPEYLMGITDAAFSVRLGEKVSLTAVARMGSAESAQQALEAAHMGLQMAKDAMNEALRDEPMMAFVMLPYFMLLNGLKLEVQDAEFHGSLQTELAQLMGILPMAEMLPYFFYGGFGGRGDFDEGDMAGQFNLHEIGLGIAMYQAGA